MNDLINQWVTKELPLQIGNKALLKRVMKRLRVKSVTPRVKREYVVAVAKQFAEKRNLPDKEKDGFCMKSCSIGDSIEDLDFLNEYLYTIDDGSRVTVEAEKRMRKIVGI